MMATSTLWFEQATDALRHSALPGLRHVRVEEEGDLVILCGEVSSYYYKQLAQETVLPFLSGGRLENRLAVVHP